MSNTSQETHHKKSKLDELKLSFEYNRTVASERQLIRHRTDDELHA